MYKRTILCEDLELVHQLMSQSSRKVVQPVVAERGSRRSIEEGLPTSPYFRFRICGRGVRITTRMGLCQSKCFRVRQVGGRVKLHGAA